jgi:hypothetical protein
LASVPAGACAKEAPAKAIAAAATIEMTAVLRFMTVLQ